MPAKKELYDGGLDRVAQPTPPVSTNVHSFPSDRSGADRQRFLAGLFRNHYSELIGRLRKLYGVGPPEPEDIAQAAFSRLAGLEDLSQIHSPRAFLFRTAVNLALNSIDSVRRRNAFVTRHLTLHLSGIVEEHTPESVFIGKQDLERVARAIERLSPKQKEILLRTRFKGQTYAQIKRETGWSQADISRQLKTVLDLLSAELDS
ncbi:RNA polymerase sigma factor [Hyphomonas sp. WL0036]|uniref:RNA polymerase sigma factor n=1 Tax=Hyphomonas sediminis TaxID=2866160 RepID=UPI001C8170B8|nr:sigma-70 family RNA polymerase sigma factor [Hyphomonas sediminis]MBY9068491.1 RNA polymerase sigma factor [Hyphomonas sediminis]